jgi:hypothetical protein
MEYDEESVLFKYVWDHCQHLMTDVERRAGKAIVFRAKAAAADEYSPEMARTIRAEWGHADDPAINSALAAGDDAFRRQVYKRLLSDPATTAFINRCPRCSRVVRTPKARQCLWCGCDWHNS